VKFTLFLFSGFTFVVQLNMLSFLAIVLVTKFFKPKRSLSTLKINSHFYFLFPNARKNWRKIFVKVEKGWNEKTLKI
jgi:hypothetical protein